MSTSDVVLVVAIFVTLVGATGLVFLHITRDTDDLDDAVPMSFEDMFEQSEELHPVTCLCRDCRLDFVLAARAVREVDQLEALFENSKT